MSFNENNLINISDNIMPLTLETAKSIVKSQHVINNYWVARIVFLGDYDHERQEGILRGS